MKKVFFVAALLALAIAFTTANAGVIMKSESIVMTMQEDDGFVDVKLENLNEAVQGVILVLAEENDLTSLKYNAEKEVIKVVLSSKEDQSEKTVYLNNEGKEVNCPVVKEDADNSEDAEITEVIEDLNPELHM